MKLFGYSPSQLATLLAVGNEVEKTCDDQGLPVARPQIGGYAVKEQIAEGGMGTVWRAVQLGTNREVALKMMTGGVFGSAGAQSRFLREVELCASLEHPYITRVYDSGVHEGLYYYAMELVDGRHLDVYVQRAELTMAQKVELFDKVCEAVQYAHQRGIIHRDLKPSNIMVTDDGHPYLLDFGLAKAVVDSESDPTLSIPGQAIGTPTTMSPEQAAGEVEAVGTYSDVYSLAVMLYKLMTDQWPYDTTGPREVVLQRIRTAIPPRPRQINPRIARDLETLILKGLEKEPPQRYQSLAELRHDLDCWCQGLPIVAKSYSSIYLLTKIVRRHRAASATVALLIVIVLSFAYVSFYSYLQAAKALQRQEQRDALGVNMLTQNEDLAGEVRREIQQQALGWFLLAYHQDRLSEAQTIEAYFSSGSPAQAACEFLLGDQSMNEREDAFRQALGPEGTAFVEFMRGEYYVNQGQMAAARRAYEAAQRARADTWLSERIEARLVSLESVTP
jgi:serine/threonine protein kinase